MLGMTGGVVGAASRGSCGAVERCEPSLQQALPAHDGQAVAQGLRA